MIIYAIWNIPNQIFLRWGVNGGGSEGYCLYRGHRCFFVTRRAAKMVISQFDNPENFVVRRFVEEVDG